MNKFWIHILILFALMVGEVWSENDNKEPPLQLELGLVDGSHIIGTPSIKSVPLQTSYAKINVPLDQIRTMRIEENHETVEVDLIGGDKIRGVINLEPIKLQTIFGKVAIAAMHVRELNVVLTGGAQSDAVARGLVLYYSFDRDEENKISDLSGKRNNGNVSGAKWTPKGLSGGAFQFESRDDYIRVPSFALPGKSEISLSAWLKTPPSTTDSTIISNFSQIRGKGGYKLSVSSGCAALELFVNGAYVALTGRTRLPNDGQWHQVVGTYDGSEMRVYLDGALDGNRTIEGKIDTVDFEIWLGRLVDGGWPFVGSMDEVRIYARTLTTEEVRKFFDTYSKSRQSPSR